MTNTAGPTLHATSQKIAVIGQGIAGMSAAWLLSQRHRVTVYEAEPRFGGHGHTVDAPSPAGPIPVDMGFIVYNAPNYPNLTAMLEHLNVRTAFTDMSFGVSLDNGDLEYASTDLFTLFAQRRNLVRPRFWSMLGDVVRFCKTAPSHACALDARMTSLGDYLGEAGYGRPFQDDHILPQAAAIWSASVEAVRELPAASFIRFFENHGLLKILDKPLWRTVVGGSRSYVEKLTEALAPTARLGVAATRIERTPAGVMVHDAHGGVERFDQVVLACHADQGLAMLAQPTASERRHPGRHHLHAQHRGAAFGPQLHAQAPESLVELELSRRVGRRRRPRALRHLLDEPAAESAAPDTAVRDLEPHQRGRSRQADPH